MTVRTTEDYLTCPVSSTLPPKFHDSSQKSSGGFSSPPILSVSLYKALVALFQPSAKARVNEVSILLWPVFRSRLLSSFSSALYLATISGDTSEADPQVR